MFASGALRCEPPQLAPIHLVGVRVRFAHALQQTTAPDLEVETKLGKSLNCVRPVARIWRRQLRPHCILQNQFRFGRRGVYAAQSCGCQIGDVVRRLRLNENAAPLAARLVAVAHVDHMAGNVGSKSTRLNRRVQLVQSAANQNHLQLALSVRRFLQVKVQRRDGSDRAEGERRPEHFESAHPRSPHRD